MVLSSHFGLRHVELSLDLLSGFGHIGKFMQHGDEIAVVNDFDAGNFFGGRGVHTFQFGVMGRRSQDFRVEHAGQPDVAGVMRFAGDLVLAVAAQRGFADDLEVGGIFQRPAAASAVRFFVPSPIARRSRDGLCSANR